MATIITATDFSATATDAVHYACSYAAQYGHDVIVIHTYIIPVAFPENPMPAMSMTESKEIAEEQMDMLMADLRTRYAAVNITSLIEYGDVTDALEDCVKKNNARIVVVGNNSEEEGFWLGSNLLSTMRNLQCAVLAVPHGYAYTNVKKICYACDYNHISGELPANDINRIIAETGAELYVLNVGKENPEVKIESSELYRLLADANPQYLHINNEDVDAGVQSFVESNGMDWLIVIPHKHSFLEGLFHKSHTKAIARHAHIPLLALHDKA